MTAFAQAVDVLFGDPNIARDALYRPGGVGEGVPVRVITSRPDKVESFGETRLASSSMTLDLRKSEVAAPAEGDTIELDGEDFFVQGTPLLDGEGLVWTLEARPV